MGCNDCYDSCCNPPQTYRPSQSDLAYKAEQQRKHDAVQALLAQLATTSDPQTFYVVANSRAEAHLTFIKASTWWTFAELADAENRRDQMRDYSDSRNLEVFRLTISVAAAVD